MAEWAAKSFNIESDNTSYFDKVRVETENKIRQQVHAEITKQANEVIHNIVLGKDAEISQLKEEIDNLKNKLEQSERENITSSENIPSSFGNDQDLTKFANELLYIAKYGKKNDVIFTNAAADKLREIFFNWKIFLEDYKWKSNHISRKIQRLLKDTEDIVNR